MLFCEGMWGALVSSLKEEEMKQEDEEQEKEREKEWMWVQGRGKIRMRSKNSNMKGKSKGLGDHRCGSDGLLVKNTAVKVGFNECVVVRLEI